MSDFSVFPELHFLVVDDIPLMRRIAVVSLRALGYTNVSEAGDGEQALKLLWPADTSAVPINFIITDWSMPVMDGIALLRTIRARADLKHLPVLMVSAQAEEDTPIAAAIRAGADGYLAKPLNAAALKKTLDAILVKRGCGALNSTC